MDSETTPAQGLQNRLSSGYTYEEANIQTELERLYAGMRPELLAYFTGKLPNPADAEDCVQRVFLRLLPKTLQPDSENLTRAVATGILKDAYRQEGREPAPVSWEQMIGPDGSGVDALAQFQTPSVEASRFGDALDVSVRRLNPEPRDAFILGELRGLTAREAGPILGVSHTTARLRREAASAHIRKEIAA
jgi:RNA polymerase sigma factor (sigma-70 family)